MKKRSCTYLIMMNFNQLFDLFDELQAQGIIDIEDEDELIMRLEEFCEQSAEDKFAALFGE